MVVLNNEIILELLNFSPIMKVISEDRSCLQNSLHSVLVNVLSISHERGFLRRLREKIPKKRKGEK